MENEETVKTGTLYLCATPIGNLEDMSYRAVRILNEVAAVAAEDTRHTRGLLTHFDIHTPLVSYHEHNKEVRGPELIQRLLSGEDIAVVSDAGMPGISDPGSQLAQLAIEAGIPLSPVPGANAALSGLVCSGLDSTMFTFVGFLPRTRKKRRELVAALAGSELTLVFYEAPHRLLATLQELEEAFGNRPATAARELTKRFEQFVRGSLASLYEHFSITAPRGEFTLIVAGAQPGSAQEGKEISGGQPPALEVMALVSEGVNKKDAIRMVASKRGLSRRDVYQNVLAQEQPDDNHV